MRAHLSAQQSQWRTIYYKTKLGVQQDWVRSSLCRTTNVSFKHTTSLTPPFSYTTASLVFLHVDSYGSCHRTCSPWQLCVYP